MAEIDSLEVKIQANATKANKAIEELTAKLGALSTALKGLNSSSLTGLANGVDRLGKAMQTMGSVKTTDFTRLAKNIERLGKIDTTSLNRAASSLSQITRAVNSIGNVSESAQQLSQLASALSRLGYKSTTNAITNIPQLANALKQLMQTLSTAPRVSSNVIQMTNALANLARQGNNVSAASRQMTTGLTRYSTATKTATKHTKGLVSQIGMFYAKFWLVLRSLNLLWKSVKSAMDYVETLNYFNRALLQVTENADLSAWEDLGYESADAYADALYEQFSNRTKDLTEKMTGFNVGASGQLTRTNAPSLGLDPDKTMQYQATFAQISSSMGVASDTALKLSDALTMIGADLASVRNMDFNKVWQDMTSGLVGMSRTWDKYGVNIRNVNLQQKLYDLGINQSIATMNQQDKAILRTIILLESTRYAWGDLANTINNSEELLLVA